MGANAPLATVRDFFPSKFCQGVIGETTEPDVTDSGGKAGEQKDSKKAVMKRSKAKAKPKKKSKAKAKTKPKKKAASKPKATLKKRPAKASTSSTTQHKTNSSKQKGDGAEKKGTEQDKKDEENNKKGDEKQDDSQKQNDNAEISHGDDHAPVDGQIDTSIARLGFLSEPRMISTIEYVW